jgi:RNA-directed DNA polymerase
VDQAQPCAMSTHAGWRASQQVQANQGAAGVDAESMTDCAGNLQDQLDTMWHRMSSGRDVPPPVNAGGLPKQTGGTRRRGMPTGGDSMAQLVATESLAPFVAPQVQPDADGSRPGQSALQAVAVTRQRCWRDDWVVAYDIQQRGDRIAHALMRRAVTPHPDGQGWLRDSDRGLHAPLPGEDGPRSARTAGTPPGGVVRPWLANRLLQ